MTDDTKNKLNIVSGVVVAVGVVGYVLTGGTEAGALNIASVAVAGLAGLIAIINAIKNVK